MMTTSCSN